MIPLIGCRIFLSHAGCNPNELQTTDVLWNREHINTQWTNEKIFDKLYIVHGHTPVQSKYFNNKEIKIKQYANNHKICIDLGTYISNIVAVLDLDSIGTNKLEVKYFNEEGIIND